MKRNDLSEAKRLDEKALIAKVMELKKKTADLVMDKHMNKLGNVKDIVHHRKDLAQYLTILRQKQLLRILDELEKVDEDNKERSVKTI